ncbi:X-X-X-Leu-X-X-Gly heptad repeat protein [Alkalibacillus flavidus]|uniref:X-X-X-Leu-X-X-Gly heptad repeat protein n=1 Tax=Alkalibacillus flavidus TaxID=546021 RepID=A0ABV2KXJ5_9BACI
MIRKTIASITALSLVLYPSTLSFAETDNEGSFSDKHEVVYTTLDALGEQQGLYVVNEFNVTETGAITDYGQYESLENLTTTGEISTNNGELTLPANEDPFYYRGDLADRQLPWTFDVTYKLDGNKVAPSDIVGQSGDVSITVDMSHREGANETFTDNFMVQVSATLNSDVFSQVEAPGGTVASAGQDQQVSFTVMPGDEDTLTLEASAESFEFDGFQISALPASMSVDQPNTSEMTDNMEQLSNGVADLHDGIAELNNGLGELNNGAVDLRNGSSSYLQGVRDLDNGSGELVGGSESIQAGIDEMHQQLASSDSSSGNLGEMASGLNEIAAGLEEAATGLDDLRSNYENAYGALDDAIKRIPDSQLSEEELQGLYQSGADQDVVDTLVSTYEAAQATKQTYNQVGDAFSAVTPALNETSGQLSEMANQLQTMAENVSSADPASGLTELENGLADLSSQYSEFHAGLVDYTNGVGELANSYSSVHSGVDDLQSGIASTYAGSNDLRDGSRELRDETSDLPEEMQNEIDSMMSDFEYDDFDLESFVSERNNEDIESVQFTIQTDSIEIEEPEDTTDEQDENESIWDRFLNLFR